MSCKVRLTRQVIGTRIVVEKVHVRRHINYDKEEEYYMTCETMTFSGFEKKSIWWNFVPETSWRITNERKYNECKCNRIIIALKIKSSFVS